jgi:hypothetical protein
MENIQNDSEKWTLLDATKIVTIITSFVFGIYGFIKTSQIGSTLVILISNQSYLSKIDNYQFTQITTNFGLTQFFLGIYLSFIIFAVVLTFNLFDGRENRFQFNLIKKMIEKENATKSHDMNFTPKEEKNYSSITDEDKIIFNHLFNRHKDLLSYVDALDTKFAQIIALNGLILSFIIFSAGDANSFNIFIFGIILIIVSMIIGAYGYFTRNFYSGASLQFFKDYDTFPSGVGIIKLKKQLILDIERNERKHLHKANIFNWMLLLVILGLILVVGGYYA